MYQRAREAVRDVDYAKYAKAVYSFTTFISALVVLVICVAIIILSSLMWPKVKSIQTTVLSLQAKVDDLTSTSWVDILYGLVELIIKFIPSLARSKTELQSALGENIRLRHAREDMTQRHYRFDAFFTTAERLDYDQFTTASSAITFFKQKGVF
jgi:hypothetical protein